MPSDVRERSSEPLPAFQPRPPSCRFHSWLIARQNGKQLRGQKKRREFGWESCSCARPGSVARGAFGHFGLVAQRGREKEFHLSNLSASSHKVSCPPWEALLSQKLSPDLSLFQDDHCSVGFSLSFHSFCQPGQRNISQGHEGMTKHNKSTKST